MNFLKSTFNYIERRVIIISVPILTQFQAFDATNSIDLFFSFDGNQVYGNQIQIYKNSDSSLIYDNSVTSFLLKHTVPANTLQNGVDYYIRLRVWDSTTTYSQYSSSLVFKCLLSPVVSLNITSNQIIQNSYYDVIFSYTQAQNEVLNEFKLILYDIDGNQLLDSDYIYASKTMTYSLTGLLNSTKYQVEIQYVTVHQLTGSTGKVTFSVEYLQPSVYYTVGAENQCNTGLIRIYSNLISITGTSNPNPPTYINNEKVNLTENGSYVYFDKGFNISNNFSLQLLGSDFIVYDPICILSNSTNTITISYMKAIFDNSIGYQGYFLLEVSNGITVYRVATTPFTLLTSGQECYVLVQRINNLYDITYQLK